MKYSYKSFGNAFRLKTLFRHLRKEMAAMKIYNFLMRQYTAGRRKLLYSFALQLALSAGALINAEIMRRGTSAIRQGDMDMLANASLLLITVIALNILCAFAQKMLRRQSSLLYQEQLQLEILSGILHSDSSSRPKTAVGDMITMVVNNAEAAVENGIECLANYGAGILSIAACTLYMFLIDWRITTVIVLFQLLVRLLLRRVNAGMKIFSERAVSAMKQSNSLTVEILTNMLTVRTSGREDFFHVQVRECEDRLCRLRTLLHFLVLGKDDLVWASTSFSEYVILYGLGGVLVCLEKADLSVMLAMAFVIGPFVAGINNLGYASRDGIAARTNMESVGCFLRELERTRENRTETREEFSPADNSISIQNLCFAYDEQEVLHHVNLEIAAGDVVELMGPSGSGKSTLLSLLTGRQKSQDGTIRIGGLDISRYTFQQLSRRYCHIAQESHMFAGDVCENIAMSEEPDKELCKRILKALNISHCQNMNPFLLSQGEKQRVNIGRAFYKYAKNKTRLLFCDEIFANLDQKNADEIAQTLVFYFQGCTILFVTHQDIRIRFVKAIRMADGRLEAI